MDKKILVENEEVAIPTSPPTYNQVMNSTTEIVAVENQTDLADGDNGVLRNSINCQVCRHFINLDQKQNNLVVKCPNCGEATPLKAAPPGKKYVRCTCNGLLICKTTSTRVGCPRPHCRSIITLTMTTDQIAVATGVTSTTGLLSQTLRVICANCGSPFIVNQTASNSSSKLVGRRWAAKCPHCQIISSIGPDYARFRYMFFIAVGLIFLAIGIGVTIGTYEIAKNNGGYYVVFVGLILSGTICTIRGIFYCFMPISKIDNPTITPQNSV